MCEGIAAELEGIDLGDKRLDERSKVIISALGQTPELSVNASCDGWGDTQAAYRFFDNERVEPEKIRAPHVEATLARIRQQPVVLAVQDTTELDYTLHPQTDARCLNSPKRHGVYMHSVLAVTPDRLALGVLSSEFFDRDEESLGRTDERRTLPIEEKESFRWLKGYRTATATAQDCPETLIVNVADREADIYDIFVEAQKTEGIRAEYIIRAKEKRSTLERNPAAGASAYHKVSEQVAASECLATREIQLPETAKRAARLATVEIRAMRFTVKPPHARSKLPAVTQNVVLVKEVNGPGDGTDVCWLLLTTLPIVMLQDIERVIKYYCARWVIEVYFRTLKTGCRVEEIQLETLSRLKKCLAFYEIIAWRILHLTYLNRTTPDIPCTAVFTNSEWKSVWAVVKRKPLPKRTPRLNDIVQLVARLGGYNNRPDEPPPGPQTLWMGLRKISAFAIAWEAFGPEEKDVCK
jgi:hypothetical protein